MGVKDGYIITNLSSSIRQRGAGVAPYTFGVPGVATLRNTCIPYSSFPGGSKPAWDRGDCGIPDTTIILPAIDGTTPVYDPDIYETTFYTEIVDAMVTGTISTHVGSVYLSSSLLTEIGILASDDGGHSDYWSTKIRRFTDNSLLVDFKITMMATSSVTETNISVPAHDWYDIYLSASTNPGTASLEGIYIKYKI